MSISRVETLALCKGAQKRVSVVAGVAMGDELK